MDRYSPDVDEDRPIVRLEVQLVAYGGQLVVLKLLEGLVSVRLEADTGGVDHARAQEPACRSYGFDVPTPLASRKVKERSEAANQ